MQRGLNQRKTNLRKVLRRKISFNQSIYVFFSDSFCHGHLFLCSLRCVHICTSPTVNVGRFFDTQSLACLWVWEAHDSSFKTCQEKRTEETSPRSRIHKINFSCGCEVNFWRNIWNGSPLICVTDLAHPYNLDDPKKIPSHAHMRISTPQLRQFLPRTYFSRRRSLGTWIDFVTNFKNGHTYFTKKKHRNVSDMCLNICVCFSKALKVVLKDQCVDFS